MPHLFFGRTCITDVHKSLSRGGSFLDPDELAAYSTFETPPGLAGHTHVSNVWATCFSMDIETLAIEQSITGVRLSWR